MTIHTLASTKDSSCCNNNASVVKTPYSNKPVQSHDNLDERYCLHVSNMGWAHPGCLRVVLAAGSRASDCPCFLSSRPTKGGWRENRLNSLLALRARKTFIFQFLGFKQSILLWGWPEKSLTWKLIHNTIGHTINDLNIFTIRFTDQGLTFPVPVKALRKSCFCFFL